MRSWDSMLRTARAVCWVLAIMAAALIVPPQTRDMLRGSWWSLIAFHLALFWLGINAWHWGRAVLSARFNLADTHEARRSLRGGEGEATTDAEALVLVPRMFFLAASAIGAIAAIKSIGAVPLFSSAAFWQLPIVAAWTVIGLIFLQNRLNLQQRLFKRMDQTKASGSDKVPWFVPWGLRGSVRSWRRLLRYAPFGPKFAFLLLIFANLAFLSGLTETLYLSKQAWWPGMPWLLANVFPGPAAALICAGLLIGPLTMLTFDIDRLHIGGRIFGFPWGLKRPPVILSLFALIALTTFVIPLHSVRHAEPGTTILDPGARADLKTYFADWAKTCTARKSDPNAQIRPIIVAISGGASRAGLWGARVLEDVDKAAADGGTAILAISSVSGGSLGTASYLSLLAGQNGADHPCTLAARGESGDVEAAFAARGLVTVEALRSDALGPALTGTIMQDLPRSVVGIPLNPLLYYLHNHFDTERAEHVRGSAGDDLAPWRGGDRAQALENAFEHNWANALKLESQDAVGRPVPFSDAFLSLFYKQTAKGPALRGNMPLWLANGTDTQSGDRILTWPASTKQFPFEEGHDALALIGSDIPISTAIDNTSRFPFLSPSGELSVDATAPPPAFLDAIALRPVLSWLGLLDPSKPAPPWVNDISLHQLLHAMSLDDAFQPLTQVIDGGYFENEGIMTALDLAHWLEANEPGVHPILVQVTDDGNVELHRSASATTRTERRSDMLDQILSLNQIRCGPGHTYDPSLPSEKRRVSEFLVPFVGLSNVRAGHSTALLREAQAEYCGTGVADQSFYQFYLYGDDTHDLPLNWVMSQQMACYIWDSAMFHGLNGEELGKLRRSLGAAPRRISVLHGECDAFRDKIWRSANENPQSQPDDP